MSEQKKFTPQFETVETSEEILSKEDYLKKALENLQITSRTAKGVIDISASADKAKKMQKGLSEQEIVNRATENFKKTIEYLYDERNRQFKDSGELRLYIENIAQQINKGITKEEVLVRSHDSDKYPYTKVKNLSQEMKQFYEELFTRLQNPSEDPKSLAGWIEYRIDLTDHFFADGCGKIAKAISAWALMWKKMPLPRYRSRDEYYAAARLKEFSDNPEADKIRQWEQWRNYYKTLFTNKR